MTDNRRAPPREALLPHVALHVLTYLYARIYGCLLFVTTRALFCFPTCLRIYFLMYVRILMWSERDLSNSMSRSLRGYRPQGRH